MKIKFFFSSFFLLFSSFFSLIPEEWKIKINAFNALFSENDDSPLNSEGYPGIYLPLIGNGYFSHSKGVRSDTYFISGVFNNQTTSPSHRARIPATFAVTIQNSTTTGTLIDMKEGAYLRRGIVGNTDVTYQLKWYAHMLKKHLYIMELTLQFTESSPDFVTLNFQNNAGLPSEDINFNSKSFSFDNQPITLQCGFTTIPETSDSSTIEVCMASTDIPSNFQVSRKENNKIFSFITSVHTSIDNNYSFQNQINNKQNSNNNNNNNNNNKEENLSEITLSCLFHSLKLQQQHEEKQQQEKEEKDSKISPLYNSHIEKWNELWKSGIEIMNSDPNYDIGIAINASMFAMLSSVRDDWPHGLAPGGLTNYYNGHSFWDTETWMYPSLLLLHPTLGKSLMQYRFDRVSGAASKAKSYDPPYEGIMFPWESAYTGAETCPLWADTGLREQHISSDIALAIWQYYSITKDKTWLESIGLPMLIGISDFWVSRITYDSQTNISHIHGVIPPDEYVSNCSDSVYTNYAAARTFEITLEAIKEVSNNDVSDSIKQIYQFYSDTLLITFNETLQIHDEYDGYYGQVIKQADVVLLHYPWEMEMTEEIQKNNLEYYSNRTDIGGPAMTWGIHSIGYKDLLEFELAGKYFLKAYQNNMKKPFYIWTENIDGGAGNFVTGAGGFLQTVIYGYPGIRIADEELLIFDPVCPDNTNGLKVRGIWYIGYKLDISFSCKTGTNRPTELYVVVKDIQSNVNKMEVRQYISEVGGDFTSYPLNEIESEIIIPLKYEDDSSNILSLHLID